MKPSLPDMIALPAGEFHFGACAHDKFANWSELPSRRLHLDLQLSIAAYPITREQWSAFDSAASSEKGAQLPMVNVSWHDANRYTDWLQQTTGEPGWRLPTEQEWECACRAGSASIFSHQDILSPESANFRFDENIHAIGPGRLTECGSYPANAWGIYDLHGNVYEWTLSPWQNHHGDDAGLIDDHYTVKGGSWDGLPRLLRCSSRDSLPSSTRRDNLGFRVVREEVPQ